MNYKLIFAFFLFFFVFVLKEFLVFNEEILVLLSFFLFIFLVINFCKVLINDSLNSKIEVIKGEFDFYKNLQKQTVLYLINYYKKQNLLSKSLTKILSLAKNEIEIIHLCFKKLWHNKIKLNFEEKLKKLISCEFQKNLFIQSFYSTCLFDFFVKKYVVFSESSLFEQQLKKKIISESLLFFKGK